MSRFPRRRPPPHDVQESGGLLLPGAPRTALIAYAATASAMLSLAPVIRPDDGGTMPGKRWVFTTRVEPVSPPWPPGDSGGEWWRRRALPPGPQRLFHTPFIAIAGKPAGRDIGGRRGWGKRGSCAGQRGASMISIRSISSVLSPAAVIRACAWPR